MEGMPQPINPALVGILARSKQVMNKLQDTKPVGRGKVVETYENSYSDEYYNENDERDTIYEQISNHQPQNLQEGVQHQVLGPVDYDADMVRNSKLPQNIKDLMISKPIRQVSLAATTPTLTNEQIAKIKGNPIMGNKQTPRVIQQESKNINSDMITISKSELKDMINEGISTFFKQVYDKTLTEETIKKTINLLIKEGKIGVKKKI